MIDAVKNELVIYWKIAELGEHGQWEGRKPWQYTAREAEQDGKGANISFSME